MLLAIRDETGVVPDIYFEWTEGNPLSNMVRFLVTGVGEVAPVTREVLRRAEPIARPPPRRARQLAAPRPPAPAARPRAPRHRPPARSAARHVAPGFER